MKALTVLNQAVLLIIANVVKILQSDQQDRSTVACHLSDVHLSDVHLSDTPVIPTGQACHMGDHVAGQLHECMYMYIHVHVFLETSLRVSSSVSSRCILHSSTSTFILHLHSVYLMWKIPYNMNNS